MIVIQQNHKYRVADVELTNLGFASDCSKIYAYTKMLARAFVLDETCVLLQRIEGLGFRRMIVLAQSMGIDPDDNTEIKGCVAATRDFAIKQRYLL